MDSFLVFNGFCLFREAVFLVFFGYVFSGLCYRHIQIRGGRGCLAGREVLFFGGRGRRCGATAMRCGILSTAQAGVAVCADVIQYSMLSPQAR